MKQLNTTQKIAYSAVFSAICVVVKLFLKVNINVSLSISFSYIPNFLAGIFLGPIYGLSVGLVGDLLGTLLKGDSISPIIMVGNSLMGGTMGFVFKYAYVKNEYLKIVAGAFCVFIIVTMGINTLAMILPPINRHPTYLIALATRIPQTIVVAVNTVLVLALYPILKKTVFKE